ncbi:MAG TPA: plastocyanin/azurin family copper-binding protein, partial [Actinomycetota bacterium]|nr:plastocyanin/azurin family copper-binding protein [Actinomycetota bacterium]
PRQGGFEVGFGEFAVTLEAPAIRPGPVTFVIRNGGELVHGFEMEAESEDDSSGSGSGDEGFKVEQPTFGPGETIRLDLDLAAGVYKIECYVADHSDRGMEILLEVRPDAPKVQQEAAGGTAVAIQGFAFAPTTLDVAAGMEVTWTNQDPAPHTVTADDGSFDSGTIDPGATFSAVFDQSGTLTYMCNIHPAMTGTVRVG